MSAVHRSPRLRGVVIVTTSSSSMPKDQMSELRLAFWPDTSCTCHIWRQQFNEQQQQKNLRLCYQAADSSI